MVSLLLGVFRLVENGSPNFHSGQQSADISILNTAEQPREHEVPQVMPRFPI